MQPRRPALARSQMTLGDGTRSDQLETGLLTVFRIFLVAQLVLILVNVLVHSARGLLSGCPWCAVAFGVGGIVLLMGYLSWPRLQARMGRLYLPAALVLAAVFSLVAQNLFLSIPLSVSAGSNEESAWQIFLFLFVPLVLASWQYGFNAVIAYCMFTTLLDFAMVRSADPEYLLIRDTYHRLLFIRFLSFMLAGYIISRIMQQLRRERLALRQANLKLESLLATLEQLTVSRERNRVARELHDTLAHTLSGVAVQLEAVDSLWLSDLGRARTILQQSLKATREGLTETRQAIQSLRAAPLEDLGLPRALGELARAIASRAGLRLDLSLPEEIDSLPYEVEQCFYRIGQEAMENAARHAEAGSLAVELGCDASGLVLQIADDGIGFEPLAAEIEGNFGLKGMRERAHLLGAAFELSSRPGGGTRIRLAWSPGDGRKAPI